MLVLWLTSTAVFVLFGWYLVHRVVLGPLERLSGEAQSLARGEIPAQPPAHDTRELGELADRYRAMAEELLDAQSHAVRVEKLAGIGRLAAGVAHEIRNPLGAIGTYTEVLRRRGSDPAVIGEMHTAIGRIDRIVQGLLDYARPGVDTKSAPAMVDLNQAVRTALDFLIAQGMLDEHRVTVELDDTLELVRADRHGLEQMVLNLLVNACQASPGGTIAVGTAARRWEERHALATRNGPAPPSRKDWMPRPRRLDLRARHRGRTAVGGRQRPGRARGRPGAGVRPVLHHEGAGRRHGPWSRDRGPNGARVRGCGMGGSRREGGAVFKVFLPLAGTTDALADR